MWTPRLMLALAAYAVLALLVWKTMQADSIRLITWAVLGMFTVRTLTQAAREHRVATVAEFLR